MSIRYAGGTIINATLTQSAGTRAELAQWVRDQLVNAGWTSTGSATDYQVTCATTTGGALAGRIRVYDPGSGNCAKLKCSNTGATKTQTGDLWLLPAVGKVWRIIANKHQFFVFESGTASARGFAAGGVPYLPTFLQGVLTECIWASGIGRSDTDAVVNTTFRSALHHSNSGNNPGNFFGLANGNVLEYNAAGIAAGIGDPVLVVPNSPKWFGTTPQSGSYRWWDDSLSVSEPLISWGLTAFTDEGKIRGQLWDAIVLSDSFAADSTITFDGHTFMAITAANVGSTTSARGTLFVAVN